MKEKKNNQLIYTLDSLRDLVLGIILCRRRHRFFSLSLYLHFAAQLLLNSSNTGFLSARQKVEKNEKNTTRIV